MTELEKYELVNKAESIEELEKAMDLLWPDDQVKGRTRMFDKNRMKSHINEVVNGLRGPNALTRQYGLRQQALYLQYYYN